MQEPEVEFFCPSSQADWRKWLRKNHKSKQSVWLVFYKKHSGHASVTWSNAVDEALCFGWIDSIKKVLDNERSIQFFSKRRPNSTWSKINKEKVERLIQDRKMTKAGLACIELAKRNGSWSILDDVEKLKIPKDLEKAFRRNKGSRKYFLLLNKSTQKAMLQWLVLAKQPQTRLKRIEEIASLAGKGQKPKQFQ